MNTKVVIGVFILIVVGFGGYLFFGGSASSIVKPLQPFVSVNQPPVVFDPLNGTYTIDEEPIALANGKFETETGPGSAMKDVVQIFGDPVNGDLDGDGDNDAAIILVENPGGTGTFYYVTAAMNNKGKTKGTNAIFIGDRIAPKTLQIKNGKIVMSYADRKPNEPMAVTPSVAISKYFIVAQDILRETDSP